MRLRVEVTRNLILGWSESNAWYSVKLFLANCLESFSGGLPLSEGLQVGDSDPNKLFNFFY